MLYDNITLLEGSDISNLTVASGNSFPSSASLGELFFRSDLSQLHVRTSTNWLAIATGGSGAELPSQAGNAGRFLTTDGTAASWAVIDGSGLTQLNASNLVTGTVSTARMGSGTANATTYLRGDGTWASVTPTRLPRATTYFGSTADCGFRIVITTNVSIPANVYSGGDAFSFYNSSASPVTITQGLDLVLRQDGTTNTGNRVLAPYGTCFIWFNTPTEAVISGSLT